MAVSAVNIPLTPQTNPGNYPPYEYHEYPKMLLDGAGKPFQRENGEPVIVNSRFEEDAFFGVKQAQARSVEVDVPQHEMLARIVSDNGLEPAKRGPGRPRKEVSED